VQQKAFRPYSHVRYLFGYLKLYIFIQQIDFMSIHISAKKGEIAKIVLMPGDPLRAKYIADNFLTDIKQVSSTRNAFYFTGIYRDKPVTVGASGMGCPSIGIYSYELLPNTKWTALSA
jgi:purine-nucleoside phosphorylase